MLLYCELVLAIYLYIYMYICIYRYVHYFFMVGKLFHTIETVSCILVIVLFCRFYLNISLRIGKSSSFPFLIKTAFA